MRNVAFYVEKISKHSGQEKQKITRIKNALCTVVSYWGSSLSHLNVPPPPLPTLPVPKCLSLCDSAHDSSFGEGAVSLFIPFCPQTPFELPGLFNGHINIGNKEVDSKIWSITTGYY